MGYLAAVSDVIFERQTPNYPRLEGGGQAGAEKKWRERTGRSEQLVRRDNVQLGFHFHRGTIESLIN